MEPFDSIDDILNDEMFRSITASSDPAEAWTPELSEVWTSELSEVWTPETAEAGTPGTAEAGTPEPAEAGAPEPAEAGTPETAEAGALEPAETGTPETAGTGTPETAEAGALEPAEAGAPETAEAGTPETAEAGTEAVTKAPRRARKERRDKKNRPVLRVVLRFFTVLLATLLLAVFALYGAMYVLAKGPSPTARRLFVMSVRETSAAYFLADWFFTPEEIEAIENSGATNELPEETDTSLVQIREPAPGEGADLTDEYGLTDDDGDGIIVESVSGPGFVGYMMVVLDPSRMMLGSPDYFGGSGLLVSQMVEKNDCVAGINGGGFLDIDGKGTGGVPIGMTIIDGVISHAYEGSTYTFVGFDDNYILHTGQMKPADAREKNIQFGCTFGPVLVSNGEPVSSTTLASGVNPRTAIGQRADGAVLLLVIEGRQAHSIGATFADLSDLMVQYGAVNACNLDGGGSSVMWFNGEYIISSISFVGERPVATAFLVKKEGAQ